MHPGDPRADPAVIDLIELAGLWVAAEDWPALIRTLHRLDDELARRYPDQRTFASRFSDLQRLVGHDRPSSEAIRRAYRQATIG